MSRSFPRRSARLAIAVALIAGAGAARAHPHVWVAARSVVVFAPDGRITGIRHAWTFDELYSAYAAQGIGAPDQPPTSLELQPLAQTNVETLSDSGYFTIGKAAGRVVAFGQPVDYSMEQGADKLLTLRFTLPLAAPASAGKAFTLQVYDPTFFVDFSFDDHDPVTLEHAPVGCNVNVAKPGPLVADDAKKLSEAFYANTPPGMDVGVKLASRAVIACP